MSLRANNKKGITLIEICVAILILSIVFGVAGYVMSYTRKETQKGLWIQQSIQTLSSWLRK